MAWTGETDPTAVGSDTVQPVKEPTTDDTLTDPPSSDIRSDVEA